MRINPKRPILRSNNPISVVGGSASVGAGGANAGTPVSVGNQLDSQFQFRWQQPWWWMNYYPYGGCSPYPYGWPYYTCSPWGWPNWGYTGGYWPPGYPVY